MSNILLAAFYAALVAGAPFPKAHPPSLGGGLEPPTGTYPTGGAGGAGAEGGLPFPFPTPSGSSEGSGFGGFPGGSSGSPFGGAGGQGGLPFPLPTPGAGGEGSGSPFGGLGGGLGGGLPTPGAGGSGAGGLVYSHFFIVDLLITDASSGRFYPWYWRWLFGRRPGTELFCHCSPDHF